jgi:hypothetical protein
MQADFHWETKPCCASRKRSPQAGADLPLQEFTSPNRVIGAVDRTVQGEWQGSLRKIRTLRSRGERGVCPALGRPAPAYRRAACSASAVLTSTRTATGKLLQIRRASRRMGCHFLRAEVGFVDRARGRDRPGPRGSPSSGHDRSWRVGTVHAGAASAAITRRDHRPIHRREVRA